MDGNTILNDIAMGVKQGEIYGFSGANSAGKTSLMKPLYHIITPDAGTITLLGERVEKRDIPASGFLHTRRSSSARIPAS